MYIKVEIEYFSKTSQRLRYKDKRGRIFFETYSNKINGGFADWEENFGNDRFLEILNLDEPSSPIPLNVLEKNKIEENIKKCTRDECKIKEKNRGVDMMELFAQENLTRAMNNLDRTLQEEKVRNDKNN